MCSLFAATCAVLLLVWLLKRVFRCLFARSARLHGVAEHSVAPMSVASGAASCSMAPQQDSSNWTSSDDSTAMNEATIGEAMTEKTRLKLRVMADFSGAWLCFTHNIRHAAVGHCAHQAHGASKQLEDCCSASPLVLLCCLQTAPSWRLMGHRLPSTRCVKCAATAKGLKKFRHYSC